MPVAAPIGAGVASAVVGSALNKNKGGSTTTVSNPSVQPYLNHLYRNAYAVVRDSSAFDNPKLLGDATQQIGNTIRGDYLNPTSNPFLQGYVNDALGLVKSNFAGQYGGAAGGNLGNSGYQEMLTRTLANTALPIYANAYNTERQNQLQASQLAPSIFQANVAAPFARYKEYSNILQNTAGGGNTQTPYFTNPAAGALGMGLAGAQIYGALNQGGQQSMGFNPFAQYGGQYLGQPDYSGGFY
jgi:hypothetical protein